MEMCERLGTGPFSLFGMVDQMKVDIRVVRLGRDWLRVEPYRGVIVEVLGELRRGQRSWRGLSERLSPRLERRSQGSGEVRDTLPQWGDAERPIVR